MSITLIFALVVVAATIYALIKRYETRLVLITAGLAMALFSLKPMVAFQQFDASMTKGSLIIAICSAMGFAAAVALTKCDVHLVALLTRPLRKLGFMLLPACMIVTGLCSVAIPSTAGLCAAVGPSMIPILIRAGFHPAIAAAAIVCSTTPALFNPGVAHNVFVAKLAEMEIMDLIGLFSMPLFCFSLAIVAGLTLVCFIYRDYKKPARTHEETAGTEVQEAGNLPEHPNVLFAIAPLVPVALLLYVSLFTSMKISVATAMIVGTIYALAVTRSNPAEVTRKFFDGMGKGYANILGIIIAAGVFAAGLKAAGVIDLLVAALTSANELARIGGDMPAPREAAAAAFAADHGVYLIRKGHRTVAAAPDGRLAVNTTGNDGMAKGGSGDVLTGLLTGLLAQGMEPFDACCAAVWIHGRAGDMAAEEKGRRGMTPADMIEKLPYALKEVE